MNEMANYPQECCGVKDSPQKSLHVQHWHYLRAPLTYVPLATIRPRPHYTANGGFRT